MAAHSRRGPTSPAADRKLSIPEASFYAAVFSSARKGSLGELRRRGCGEEEAEEIFTAAFERVMETVDPIARGFSEAQMVSYVKRACWFRLIDERRRRGLRAEIGLGAIRSLSDPSAPDSQEIAEEHETVAFGHEALLMLSERDRLIFRQRHQMNLSPAEIQQNTPGLSPRTYRKIIHRANARVLDAFDRIQGGERCEEMRGSLLRRYVAEESPAAERRAIEAHLAHCRACGQTQARMRGYLVDVASGLLVASSVTEPSQPTTTAHLIQLGSQAVQALEEVGREVRERVREALLRLAVGLPSSGGDATAGQALSASAKVVSACAGLAASVCLAAGVVPGVGGIDLPGHQKQTKVTPVRSAVHLIPSSERSPLIDPLPRPNAPAPTGDKELHRARHERDWEAARQTPRPSTLTAQPASPVSNSPSNARVSGRQTGTEVGAESGGQPLPTSPAPGPSDSPSESDSGSATDQTGQNASKNRVEPGGEFGM